jgi:hypoxanthine phosphoribosyltransferase
MSDEQATAGEPTREPRFAHDSERELASILDFYQIAWLYEPRTFPLRWDAAGQPTESFAPDFYLPELDLYVELTTLKQSLVTKKNRKLRRLRELYPDVNIKLLYGRDFRSLMTKYGLHRGLEAKESDSGEDSPEGYREGHRRPEAQLAGRDGGRRHLPRARPPRA